MCRKTAALMGALTADAAGLGLHWVYDVARIAQVVGDSPAAFTPISVENYAGKPEYFVHGARRDGQLSQYGETLALVMRSILAENKFDAAAYQIAFTQHFGPGGGFVGYIDRPTRGTLANIAAGNLHPSGIDDDQHPAITTLPAVISKHGLDSAKIKAAIEVTNVNETASHFGALIAKTLACVMDGAALNTALEDIATSEPLLQKALESKLDSIEYGEITRRACHLHQGTPLSWHILAHTTSYQDAVETNIKAGGDSAGRAMIVGALAGAAYGMQGIPKEWLDALEGSAALMKSAERLGR
ncbi:MAG: ADP-ribosylglycohydrolase family protein [Roseobacter sp.]